MVNVSKIRELLKEHGWSASYLCRTFGKSPTWLADMERGRGLPDESTIKAIANKLDTTIDYLTDKTDKKNKPTAKSDELGPKGQVIWEKLKEIEAIDHDTYEFAVKQLEIALRSAENKDNH